MTTRPSHGLGARRSAARCGSSRATPRSTAAATSLALALICSFAVAAAPCAAAGPLGHRPAGAPALAPAIAAATAPPTRAAATTPSSAQQHARALAAIATLAPAARGRLTLEWQRDGVLPALITGVAVATAGATPAQRAGAFVATHADLFGPWAAELRVSALRQLGSRTVVVLDAHVDDLPLLDNNVTLTFDARSRVVTVVSDLPAMPAAAARPPAGPPSVAAAAARSLAQLAAARWLAAAHRPSAGPASAAAMVEAAAGLPAATGALAVAARAGRLVRVWPVEVVAVAGSAHLVVTIDADSGALVALRNRVQR